MGCIRILAVLIIAFGLLTSRGLAADDILIADFEGETFGDWKVTGTAFGPGPARGTLPNQMPVSGFLGKGLANSYHGGDDSTGTLTSPEFKVQRPFINFLIGGGKYPGETCINLLIDGNVVHTATGPNDKPGGSEQLDWHTWDVRDLIGKSVVIEIVDNRKGGWGHICVDHIIQSEKKKQAGPASRELTVEKPYLHLPVKTGATMRRMKFTVDDRVVHEFEIELSDEPAFEVFADVSEFKGKKLKIEVNKLPENSQVLAAIIQSDAVPDAEHLYKEKLRPQFHFTSRRGWLNDPNGLVFANGEYHLFYQHNPYGWNWGNMHWGHAVSKDLIHWREMADALYPKQFGDWCFSGSAVVDAKNSSGFKAGKNDLIVAAFTSTGRGECIVYSNDNGNTWTEYEKNPVVKHAGRDPRLLWHEPSKKWIMAVYDEFQGKQWIAFYSSPNLKQWTFESRVEGFFECPDMFELPVKDEPKQNKWVLYAADGKYMLGQFDGKKFTPESGKNQLWHGNFYAAQTFSNVPDGRRIQIGWGQGITFPGMPFNQQMAVPSELTLRRTKDGVRMFAEPVKEVESLHGRRHEWKDWMVGREQTIGEVKADSLDIQSEWEVSDAETFGFNVRGVRIVYDAKKQELLFGRDQKLRLSPAQGRLRLRMLVDRGSIEVFVNDGEVAISIGNMKTADDRLNPVVIGGGINSKTKLLSLEIADLKSVWQR
ncbi:MAG TPA: glycoside hydrolase family 32 protein [Gemmataceae bacterium]|nr:glycoside hydrolase family 32 protein [Gemmataceae bacterium]